MKSTGRRSLAVALVRHTRRESERKAQNGQLAVVRGLGPLRLELMDDGIHLDEDDYAMSQGVHQYDIQYGIEVGDNILVDEKSGHYTLVQVLAKKSVQRYAFEGHTHA